MASEKRSSMFVASMLVSSNAPGDPEKLMRTVMCGTALIVALVLRITAATILTVLCGYTLGTITMISLIVSFLPRTPI